MTDQQHEIDKLRHEIVELKGKVSSRDSFIDQLQQDHDSQSKELVRKAMCRCIDWKDDIPVAWKQDAAFVQVAIAGIHTDWKSVPEPCRWHPGVVVTALRYSNLNWFELPERFQRHDWEIALYGVEKNYIDPDKCPWLMDRPFVKEKFLNGKLEWQNFPTELKTDIEFARSIEEFPTTWHACQIFEHFLPLRHDRATWVKAVEAGKQGSSMWDEYSVFAPAEIRSDRDLMVDACAKDEEVLRDVDESLAVDRAFLFAVAERNGRMVMFLSVEVQRLFPDVVDLALQQFEPAEYSLDELSRVVNTLASEFWQNRDFVLRWFQLGFPFVKQQPFLRPEWKADREIFLLIAEHCRPQFLQKSFSFASRALRRDKKFMLQILEIQPLLCRFVARKKKLRNDFDLCLLTFSGDQSAAQSEVSRRQRLRDEHKDRNEEYGYVEAFRSEVLGRLDAHNSFTRIVLPAMSQATDSGCALAVLNQGAETSRAYKKRMAEYLDIPTGKRLRLHRQAARNLNAVLVDGDDNDGS